MSAEWLQPVPSRAEIGDHNIEASARIIGGRVFANVGELRFLVAAIALTFRYFPLGLMFLIRGEWLADIDSFPERAVGFASHVTLVVLMRLD